MNKKELYENIIKNVAKEVKNSLNEYYSENDLVSKKDYIYIEYFEDNKDMVVGVGGDGGFHFFRLQDLLFALSMSLDIKHFNGRLSTIKNMINSKEMMMLNCDELPYLIVFNPETGEKIDWEAIYNCFIENKITLANIKKLNCMQECFKSHLANQKRAKAVLQSLSESTNNLIVKDKFVIFMQAMNDYLNSNSEYVQVLQLIEDVMKNIFQYKFSETDKILDYVKEKAKEIKYDQFIKTITENSIEAKQRYQKQHIYRKYVATTTRGWACTIEATEAGWATNFGYDGFQKEEIKGNTPQENFKLAYNWATKHYGPLMPYQQYYNSTPEEIKQFNEKYYNSKKEGSL